MALNAEEQELFDFAVAALPKWFTSDERQREELYGFAKVFGSALATVRYWFGQTLIGTAQGPATGLPDWLNQHAIDRGTRRQADETDPALRQRLQNAPDAVIRSALLAAADAILSADGVAGNSALVELPQHGAHSGIWDVVNGVGGTIAHVSGTTYKFTPDTLPWPRPPYWASNIVPLRTSKLWFNTVGGNAGVFTVDSLDGDAAVYANAAAVPGAYPAIPWQWRTYNQEGFLTNGEGRAFSRGGYRSARRRPLRMIVILPYGTSAATAASVQEAMRQKKAGGIAVTIERRLIAP